MRGARPLAALGVAASLAACAPWVETDQARLCRIAMPALWPDAQHFQDLRQTGFSDGTGLKIDFTIDGATTQSIACRFKAPGRPHRADDLAEIRVNGEALAESKLYFLERFWLSTPEGRASDPSPFGDVSHLPTVAPTAAYALQQLVDGLPLAAVYGLVAAAYALVYALVGRINLAFGAFVAVGGYAVALGAALIGPERALSLIVAGAVLAAATAAAWGRAASRVVFEPLREASGQQNLVATVGLALALSEFLRLAEGAHAAWLDPMLNQPIGLARAGGFVVAVTPIALTAAAVALLSAAALLVFMHRSAYGRRWRAMCDDRLAASLCGLDPVATFRSTFALACGLAGLGGATMALCFGSVGYAGGFGVGLKALVAAVVGGIGSLEGAMLGGLLVGFAEALWSGYFAADYRDVALFTVLTLLLTLRQHGLFGAADPGQSFLPPLNRRN